MREKKKKKKKKKKSAEVERMRRVGLWDGVQMGWLVPERKDLEESQMRWSDSLA